jgi:hypothetical protein
MQPHIQGGLGWAPEGIGAEAGGIRWRSWLHTGRSRVRFPMVSLEFFIYNPSGRIMTLDATQPLIQMSTRNISWGQRRPVHRADNLTTFMCRLSLNLGASTSWDPQGLSRPVMGLLYLHLYRGRGVKLITRLLLGQRLRMSGAIPLLSLHVFKAWKRKKVPIKIYAVPRHYFLQQNAIHTEFNKRNWHPVTRLTLRPRK